VSKSPVPLGYRRIYQIAAIAPAFGWNRTKNFPSAAQHHDPQGSFREFAIMAARGRRALKFCEMQAAFGLSVAPNSNATFI
jgi:hypothetical protein